MTDFCICRAIVSLLSPTSSLRAFLTSLEYPPSTSTIILNLFHTIFRISLLELPTQWPILCCLLGIFLLPVFNPRAAHLYHRYFLILLVHDGSVDPIRLYVSVLSAYKGMSQYAIALSFSYIGLGWIFENQGTSDVTRSSALIT